MPQRGRDRATKRYYEREGFITSERMDNGYRTFLKENVDTLRKINFLRKLGLSLEQY